MASRAKETNQVAKILTPNCLALFSAEASARHIVNCCLPVLHDYFMVTEPDVFYIRYMTLTKAKWGIKSYKPRFSVSRTRESLVAHMKLMKDFYWSSSILCPKSFRGIRSLISKEIVKMLNSGELKNVEVVSPLCKFVIQLLFCCEFGDLSRDTIRVPRSACPALASLLRDLGPFHGTFLDARSLEFSVISPFEVLLASAPHLTKIFVREMLIGKRGMDMISRMCSERLEEFGIERGGHFVHRCQLFELFFKGQSQPGISKESYRRALEVNEITFPKLVSVYVRSPECDECFHGFRFFVRKLYPRLVLNAIDEPHYHAFCDLPCCEDVNEKLKLSSPGNFSNLILANPTFKSCPVKFLNDDSFINVNVLELSGSSYLFLHYRVETYLSIAFPSFRGLKLFISLFFDNIYDQLEIPEPDLWLPRFDNVQPRDGQGYSQLLKNVGKTLWILIIHVTFDYDLREALLCLNLCPVLREFTLYLFALHLTDIAPLLTIDLKPLPELTKIEFCGRLKETSVSIERLFEKIIKAAPNVQYLIISDSMVNDIHLMSSKCFVGIKTLHLKNVAINKHNSDILQRTLQMCPDLRELVLERVFDATDWVKQVDLNTALTVRSFPSCSFLEEI